MGKRKLVIAAVYAVLALASCDGGGKDKKPAQVFAAHSFLRGGDHSGARGRDWV